VNKVIVLGSGRVGSAIAADLAQNYSVTIADIDGDTLTRVKNKNPDIGLLTLDVSDKNQLIKNLRDVDLVVCAVPGFLGYQTLETVIRAGRNCVDISFSPENTLELNQLAKEKKVTALVDCGVAPGMDNLILGYHNEKLELNEFECLVGGLPKVKMWPFCYKAPFSPVDVIEEYIRPARYVENGNMITKEPLSDCEYVEFEKVGTLEAFNTDGLRSILFTMSHIPNMREKTLRYPGHAEYIKVLKKSGFFNRDEIKLNGREISPLQFTAKILGDEWKLQENEEEITVMRVTLTGKNQTGESRKIIYELHDEYCRETQTTSMARTTGYTATACANMILEKVFTQNGVFPLERIGRNNECFQYILDYLREREIHYVKTVETF